MAAYGLAMPKEADFHQNTEYYIVREVGKGAYSTVFLARQTKNPLPKVALKRITINPEVDISTVQKEYDIHKELTANAGHENIVKMLGMMKDSEHYNFFMEFADKGTVLDLIQKNGQPTGTVRRYFRQLITGLEFMHNRGVTHCDIKPLNLLLTKFEVLKIADFGLSSKHIDADGNYTKIPGHIGTRQFAAPEVWTKEELDGPPTDIWSTGIVLVELLTGLRPWKTAIKKKSSSYLQWTKKETNLEEAPWCMLDRRAIKLVTEILCPDPEKRFTITQIQSHDWYTNENESLADRYESARKVWKRKQAEDETAASMPSCNPSTSQTTGNREERKRQPDTQKRMGGAPSQT